jgi:hypothetical protein
MTLCFTPNAPAHTPQPLEKIRELKRKIEDIRYEAESLRDEASELEEKADDLEESLNAMIGPEKCDVVSAAAIAAWMLDEADKSQGFAPFIRDSLSRAIDQDEMRIVRTVALWFGLGLPAECWPSVPSRERVARVDPTWVVAMPLWQWRAAA